MAKRKKKPPQTELKVIMENGNAAVALTPPTVKMVQWYDEHWYKLALLQENGLLETRWFSSVTTKLNIVDKPFLPRWRGDVGNREADMRVYEAQERGSRIHHAWAVFCNGGVVIYNPHRRPNYTDEEIAAIKAEHKGDVFVLRHQDEMHDVYKLQKLVDILNPTMVFSEKIVYSLKNQDAGTADNAWIIKEGFYPVNGKTPLFIPGGKYLLDLKTGSMVSDEAKNQTAAYVYSDEEMGSEKYAGTIILHTGAKTKTGIPGLGVYLRTRPDVDKDYQTYRVIAKLWDLKNEDAAPRVFEFPSLITMQPKEKQNEPTTSDATNA